MSDEMAEYPALRAAKELAGRFPQFPYVVELNSTAFGVALDQEWRARNPKVPLLLSVEKAKSVTDGRFDRANAMQAIELMLILMPVEDRSPSIEALRASYRELFVKAIPDIQDRLMATLNSGADHPSAQVRACLLALNLWPGDPCNDPKALNLLRRASSLLGQVGEVKAAAHFAALAEALAAVKNQSDL